MGVHADGAPRTPSIRHGPKRCSTKPAGATATATASASKDGQPLAFTLITQAGFAVRENVAQVLQRQFRDVGVDDGACSSHDGTSISTLWFEGKFDAMLHWWQMPADPELTLFFAADRMPPHGRNINYVEDDALTDAGLRGRPHRRARPSAARSWCRRRRASPSWPSSFRSTASPSSTRCRRALQGFTGNPTNTGAFWNVHEWTLQ